jgi:hypothetical protein
MAHRSASSNGLIRDNWVWEDQVAAATAMLEKEVVVAVKRAVKAQGQDKCSPASATGESVFALAFDGDGGTGEQATTGCQAYMLTTLLSPESLDTLRVELAQDSTGMVYIPKSPEACQAQLAIDRLKSFSDFNQVQKELPQVQNPPGTRAARLKREEAEREASPSKEEDDV